MVTAALQGRKAIVVKLGMDAHWRGAIVVANALKNAGMEVVYLGHASAVAIVNAVVQEDAALLGMSSLSGNHLSECEPVIRGLRSAGVHDVAVVLGGTIPTCDEPGLRAIGVDAIFPSGTPLPAIVTRIAQLVAARRPHPAP